MKLLPARRLGLLLLGAALYPAPAVPPNDPFAPADCELATATPTTRISLGEAGVSAPCIVVSAGDVITWDNPLDTPITIRAGRDQLFTEDVTAALSSFEVPARGSLRLRAIHAGRIDYAAPARPGLGGTILVLGHESAA